MKALDTTNLTAGGGLDGQEGNMELTIISYLDHLSAQKEIRSIGIGVPVILENDLNATAIGFGLCYENEYPWEDPENTNMAYLHFEKGCVSAGFITGGRIVRGCGNFAGELGLIPMNDGRTLDEWMAETTEDTQYTALAVQVISWICGILNPQYIALGGSDLRSDCIGPISDGIYALLPKHMSAPILYSPDVWHDYHAGMAYLTAEKMFDEILFVKE